uniref:GTPase EngC n=1 Tax=Paulinella chromatophora TaxID=39717 RepID=B1X4I5_PAUCH|nr:GTPase EngC [Paulinella chromatophora]ACB42854.1 GTPase EngC [Paulinella chromatophora]
MKIDRQQKYQGLVIALQANFYQVLLNQLGSYGVNELLCTCRTRLTQRGERICVGDQVEVESIDWKQRRAVVVSIGPRSSILKRPMVANCTRTLVVVTLNEPNLNPDQLSRFLLTAEAADLPIDVVFNKSDLVTFAIIQQWQKRVYKWGYASFAISSRTGEGLHKLRKHLKTSSLSVICGPSGVGKSSLINSLIPKLNLKVGSVSGRLQRGRHTTRHVELFPIEPNAMIADTPGFNRPDLPDEPQSLGWLFPEIRYAIIKRSCRFRNCLHQGDLGCAIGIEWDRYRFYRQSLEELLEFNKSNPVSFIRNRKGI